MAVVTTSAKGQIVIPADVRVRAGLRPGTKVSVSFMDGQILIEPVSDDPVKAAFGMLRGDKSLTAALAAVRKEDHAREEAKIARLVRAARLPRRRARRRRR
jgi:AbrB family looped-hinge helix DNA binding protein